MVALAANQPSLRSSWSFQRRSPDSQMTMGKAETRTSSWQNSQSSSGTVGPLWKKFGTVSSSGGGQANSAKRASTGALQSLFDNVPEGDSQTVEKQLHMLEEQAWEISVAERRPSGKRNKSNVQSLTIYVTTPTSSLTLARTYSQLSTFDAAVHRLVPVSQPSPISMLSDASISPSSSPPRKRRSPFLASLSRTLSPSKTRQMKSLLQAQVEGVQYDPTSVSEESPASLSQISAYLSDLAKLPAVRESKDWVKFFSTKNSEDSESHRVERRIKRIRSDPAVPSPTDRAEQISCDASDTDDLAELAALSRQLAGEDASDMIATSASITVTQPQPTIASVAASASEQIASAVQTESAPIARQAMSDEQIHETLAIEAIPAYPKTPSPEPMSDRSTPTSQIAFPKSARSSRIVKSAPRKMSVAEFDVLHVLGKGCAGKVMLVRQKDTSRLYAMKAIHKHHVLAHRELAHTLTEQSVLKSVAEADSNPFVVKLHYSIHDKDNLFLVLDYHPGGDLATQLSRWGRLGRDRARFYTAEISAGLEELHHAGVIYRDLKPENILIAADGHIVLTDFGLSKQFARPRVPGSSSNAASLGLPAEFGAAKPAWMAQTGRNLSSPPGGCEGERETCTTFCGTAEYLAPEVLLGDPYSYECDAWSLGTMLYEMLSGMTPFWSEDHTTMYRKVLHDELTFDPEDRAMDHDTKSLLRGLLQKDPSLRMTDRRIKKHPYFSMIDWSFVYTKKYIPPYVPSLNPDDELDTSHFDETFLSMKPAVIDPEEIAAQADSESINQDAPTDKEPLSPVDDQGQDVFCGYSFRGPRDAHSIYAADEGDEEMAVSVEALSPAVAIHDEDEPDHEHSSSPSVSISTRPTSCEVSLGHMSKDPSAASDLHQRRQSSTGLESLAEDAVLQPAADLQGSSSDLPAPVEEEEWDVVESEGPQEEYSRMGRMTRGPTFWSRGIADRYVLAVATNSSTPKGGRRAKGLRSINSRVSSRSSGDGNAPDSPGMKRKPLSRSTSERSGLGSPRPLRLRLRGGKSKASLRQASSNNNSTVHTPTEVSDSKMSRSASNLTEQSEDERKSSNLMKRIRDSAIFNPRT